MSYDSSLVWHEFDMEHSKNLVNLISCQNTFNAEFGDCRYHILPCYVSGLV